MNTDIIDATVKVFYLNTEHYSNDRSTNTIFRYFAGLKNITSINNLN